MASLSWIVVIRQEEQGRSHAVLVDIGGQACTHGCNHTAAATLQETQWSGAVKTIYTHAVNFLHLRIIYGIHSCYPFLQHKEFS